MERGLRVAYLVNQYPKVSHTFIRREIHALERLGVVVERFALRGWEGDISDPVDVEERARTRYAAQGGLVPLAAALGRLALRRPRRALSALHLALRMARRGDRSWPYHLAYLAEACRLLPWIAASECSHVHAHFGTNSAEVAMLVRELGGPPYSFTVHGPEEFDRPEFIALAEKIRRAEFVVAISSFGRSQIYRWIEVGEWRKVRVVHCGVEPGFHEGAPREPVSAPRLVCVGRLCAQKGQLMLLEAVAQVLRRGVQLQLVLAGDGEMRKVLEERIDALMLRDHVRITGWISSAQVRTELLAARALVLPSFAEGLPVVIMEAMSLGRPVISTFVAGIPELVRPGFDGWLFPAGDVEALATTLEAVLSAEPRALAAMGVQARARVLHRHDVDREAAKLATWFAEVPYITGA